MAAPQEALFDAIVARMAEGIAGHAVQRTQPPTPAATPEPPTLSETDKVKAITAIISESYAMSGVPEHVRRRCAKRRIEAEFGEASAVKFLRGRKRNKVPAPAAAESEQPPPLSTQPPPAAATAPAPAEPTPPPQSDSEPVLKLNTEISSILSSARQQ